MSEWFTIWLLWLLGIELPPAGEGMQWHLEGSWRWSPPVIVLLVVFAVLATAFVLFFYFRERSPAGRAMRTLLAGLRLSLIFLVLLVMLFELRLHFSRTSLPYLGVVIDESGSMDTADSYDDSRLNESLAARIERNKLPGATRLNIVKSLLLDEDADLLRQLARRYTLKTYTVADTDRKHASDIDALVEDLRKLEPEGKSSRLGTCLRGVLNDLRGTQPAALIIWTDGITTEGPSLGEVAEYARRKAVPLFVIGVGSEKKVRDVDLADLLVDDIVFVDDYVDFDFKLTANGLEGRSVELVLKNKKTGEVLGRSQVTVTGDGVVQRERMSHRPTKVGTIEYVIEVANLAEELKGKQVSISREVEVRDDPIKVLLVQARPSFEYRYLKTMLERDETIDLSVVLQEADIEFAEADRVAMRVFPVSREGLFEYDVLIMGDVNLAYFSRSVMDNIVDFVKVKGGGLLFVSGEQFNPAEVAQTPLASLLPIELDAAQQPGAEADFSEGFAIRPTLLGLTSPHMQLGDTRAETESIWRNLPEIYWLLEANKVKQGARVLAEHPTRTGNTGQKLPLMIVYYVPPGKVIWHATDETYRWRYRVGDALFARYWVQAIRYLSRSKLLGNKTLELSVDKKEYQRGAPAQLRVRFFDERLAPAADDGVTVVVKGTGQKKRRVTLRRSSGSRAIFEGMVSNLGVGNYRAWVATPSLKSGPAAATFKVVPPQGEAARKELDAADLKSAGRRSRGKFYDLQNVDELIRDLPRGRPVKVASLPPIPLWNNWRLLMLFVTLLVCEWLLRKRKGML